MSLIEPIYGYPVKEQISKENINKDALHETDKLLANRMSIIVKMKKEDGILAKQDKYNKNYDDYNQQAEIILDYFQNRLKIVKAMNNELIGGCNELDDLISKYPRGKDGFEIISSFKLYFDAYRRFVETACDDIEDKISASNIYKSIVKLETNQQLFFDMLKNDDIPKAKELLDKEGELIQIYRQQLKDIKYKSRIPTKWKDEFIVVYISMNEWNKKYFNAKEQKNQNLYNQLMLEGAKVMQKIPFYQSKEFSRELGKIMFDIPGGFQELEENSAKYAEAAYTLYYLQKIKVGEVPIKFYFLQII